jgi:putative ABC transport system permease protein
MDTLWQDLHYGFRMLAKNPGLAAVALLTIALGIGANTAIFSITDQVLFRSLPVVRPQELVILRSPGPNPGRTRSDGDTAASFSYPMYKDLRDRNQVFTGLLARLPVSLSISGQGQTERAAGELVSGNYFEVLGVRPAIGRVFSSQDETAPGANPLAVLSYAYWTRHFGNDPSVLNKQISINGTSLTIVGVSQAGFTGIQLGQLPNIFIPVTMKAQMTPNWDGLQERKDHWLALMGRLKPRITPARAETGIAPIYRPILDLEAAQLKSSVESKNKFLAKRILLQPGVNGRQILQRDARAPLSFLMTMVGLVLLIACANLASLLIARGEARQREMAVRLTLGAGRGRLVRQLLTENLLLALAGGALGLLVAQWTLAAIVSSIPPSVGALGIEARLDHRVLAFSIGLSILAGFLFGLAPALRATRASLQTVLKDQGSSISSSSTDVRLRKWLMVSQVALTAVLLTGAGLFAQSLINLNRVDLGLRADHMIEFSLEPELNRYSPAQTAAFFDRLREGIAAVPGVRSVSLAEIPVLEGSSSSSNITVEGYVAQENEDTNVGRNSVGPNYFSTMGTPLLAGREFSNSDTATSPKVAIVNEAFANRFLKGGNAVGHRLAIGSGNDVHPDIEIVGVVKYSKGAEVREESQPFMYFPYSQNPALGSATVYTRTSQDPVALAATLRKTVAGYDPNLPVFNLMTFEEQVDQSVFADRLVTYLSTCLALLASLLAAVGLYGVMAYVVARRTREIGIRMALGATQKNVSWLILREVIRMTLIGLVIGLPCAYAIGRLVESLLYGVKASDPLVFLASAILLAGVALLAGGLPALKAASVDPMVALRYE